MIGSRLRRIGLAGLLATLALASTAEIPGARAADKPEKPSIFARDNLIAWCIVPFDSKKRSPEERAAMLERLGFKHFAYDWRAEHVPTFDAEVEALKRHHVSLDAFWLTNGELNPESQRILDLFKRHGLKTEIWVTLGMGNDRVTGEAQTRRVQAAAARVGPLAKEAGKIGCRVALYNHGGWFGEPENQIAIIEQLKKEGVSNVGIVYNLHHGHDHLDRFPRLLKEMMPYLVTVNINGTEPDGEKKGKKILPLGQGSLDLGLLRTIRDSGYHGPIGILGHTMDDAEERLRDNLDGLDWLVPQLDGAPAGPKPQPRTLPAPAKAAAAAPSGNAVTPLAASGYDPQRIAKLVAEAKAQGNVTRGAEVFAAAQFGCFSCHKVGQQGGSVGPDLTTVGRCLTPDQIVESVLWPKRLVKKGFEAIAVGTADGRVTQGYKTSETDKELTLKDATGADVRIAKSDVEEVREIGTLMPEGLTDSMPPAQVRDLLLFLMVLGHSGGADAETMVKHAHGPASFEYDRKPLHPENWPYWQEPVNRQRIYDFYGKEADYFGKQASVPPILPPYPGLDGGQLGHWGNQNEGVWNDGRWNDSDLGSVLSGIFRGAGVTVPKGVCVRLGERGELATCFNPETLRYEALWNGGFVKFSTVRHGFMDGLIMNGTPLPRPEGKKADQPFVYHGFYRNGKRVIFSYRLGDVEMLDAPWVEDGKFVREVGPANTHRLAALTKGGAPQWPQVLETKGKLGQTKPYAVDSIGLPIDNPWKALFFFGDNDFLDDGTALACTIQGDVWRVEGLDDSLQHVRWRRVASGLHQALGLVVAGGQAHILGRDQITRLHDLNGDGEADFYECVSNAYITSPAGHDFICALQRDSEGNFYTASGKQGILKIFPDGKRVEVLATGFRNPDGLGLSPDGVMTVPNTEGDWTPASTVCEVRPGGHYGSGGPRDGKPPELPLVYIPRGLDNSGGGQVTVTSDRWGPLKGQTIHFSHGAGTYFLLLREQVDGQPQGAVVQLPGEFLSGVHRGRFSPRDGQLYVSGTTGWGTYTVSDGSFERIRYTGDPVQLPVAYHIHQNGVRLTFTSPIDRSVAEQTKRQFAQVWNYRYSRAYGSPEFSPKHPGMPGHDALTIRSATVLDDGKSLFLEIPELQPVNVLHLRLQVDAGPAIDLFGAVNKLAAPFTGFSGYTPVNKVIAAHPILSDMAMAGKTVANPWRKYLPNVRPVLIEAGKNLTFSVKSFSVRPGEAIKLTFLNPDVVPHNWVLIKDGSLAKVGDLVNKIVADPEAVVRHYVPQSDDVLAWTDMVTPQDQCIIFFKAPTKKGRYPFLCSFPGHWMVMNGVMVVE